MHIVSENASSSRVIFNMPKIGILKGNCHSIVSPFAFTTRLKIITKGIKKTTNFITLDHSKNIFDMAAMNNEDKKRTMSIMGCSKIMDMSRIDDSHVIFKNGETS